MEDFQQKVIDEKTELDSKITKLRYFVMIDNDTFKELPKREQRLLKDQLNAMNYYSSILKERIKGF